MNFFRHFNVLYRKCKPLFSATTVTTTRTTAAVAAATTTIFVGITTYNCTNTWSSRVESSSLSNQQQQSEEYHTMNDNDNKYHSFINIPLFMLASARQLLNHSTTSYCDAAPSPIPVQQQHPSIVTTTSKPSIAELSKTNPIRHGGQMIHVKKTTTDDDTTDSHNNDIDDEEYYYDLFPIRQLFVPRVEYPLWDENWDERQATYDDCSTEQKKIHQREIRKNGITRHLIFVRHGQYDETYKEDEKRILTPLGREQAQLTGERIAEMIKGAEESFGSPCRVNVLRVSNLSRAKETANIIASYLPDTVNIIEPDPMLNEGRPCHIIPGGRMSPHDIKATDHQHPRIEGAFRKYIYRADPPSVSASATETTPTPPESQHEFEIIVCHANVIRYFMCRALQLPPEAWLRFCPFNCSLTYLTVRPTGTVSCRMIGDIGHLPYSKSTFSGHHGYNW